MNYIQRKWLHKNLKIVEEKNKTIIINKDSVHHFMILPKINKITQKKVLNYSFEGRILEGKAPIFKIINRKKDILFEAFFNTNGYIDLENIKYYFFIIYIPEKTKIEFTSLNIDYSTDYSHDKMLNQLKNDILLISPNYPSENNKYNTAFVHSRIQGYKKNNINIDLLVINQLPGIQEYDFENIHVIKGDYYFLREILSKKNYKKILVHFFDKDYANVFDSIDLNKTQLYFYLHGAEILFKERYRFASPYFEESSFENDCKDWKLKEYIYKKYNEMPNVKWIFVSDFLKKEAEKSLNIKFSNYEIIPCGIDTDKYCYTERTEDKRYKIFILRRFTNDSCYAIDIDVRTILELSRRDIFNKLEFNIYGEGELFDELTEPIQKFKNVHLHKKFLTHDEIRKVHENHGIGLFASRFDTQGVSLCEAASSGCAIITSNISPIKDYLGDKIKIMCDTENYIEYADKIEKLVTDKKYFNDVAKKLSEIIKTKFEENTLIKEEITKIIKCNNNNLLKYNDNLKKPILSVIIPSYNVEKYLNRTVKTLINHRNASKMEILIVNDGSKDLTAEIGKNLEKETINGKQIIKLINKENGGHGSTINVGIEKATGKYLKIVDGDDTVDSHALEVLIDRLENETVDLILNNYIEDYAIQNIYNYKNVYPFMKSNVTYMFEDLCYENYGFDQWGPILSCSTYRTQMLKEANFSITEKCFYVDMELNANIALICKTVKYYPLYLYRYLLGRTGQSVNQKSYMKNYKDHEKIIFKIINLLNSNKYKISEIRYNYIKNKIILTMIKSQYIITIDFYNKGKLFKEFDKKLKKYPEYYNCKIINNPIRFHRITKGLLIRFNIIFVKMQRMIKKIIRK